VRSAAGLLRLVRYGLVGILSAATHLGTTLLLVEGGVARPVYATNVGFLLSMFRSVRPHLQAFPRFLSVVGVSAALNAAIVGIGNEVLGTDYRIAQLVAIVVIPIVNFTGNRLWTFKDLSGPDGRGAGGQEDVPHPDARPRS
jgi:putative flippase GtrA